MDPQPAATPVKTSEPLAASRNANKAGVLSSPTSAGKNVEVTPVHVDDKEDPPSDQDDIDALEALAAVEGNLAGALETPTETKDN
jgi:hypothetical protein